MGDFSVKSGDAALNNVTSILTEGGDNGQVLTADGSGGSSWEDIPVVDSTQLVSPDTLHKVAVANTGSTIEYNSVDRLTMVFLR